jgi:hypothetical protein
MGLRQETGVGVDLAMAVGVGVGTAADVAPNPWSASTQETTKSINAVRPTTLFTVAHALSTAYTQSAADRMRSYQAEPATTTAANKRGAGRVSDRPRPDAPSILSRTRPVLLDRQVATMECPSAPLARFQVL